MGLKINIPDYGSIERQSLAALKQARIPWGENLCVESPPYSQPSRANLSVLKQGSQACEVPASVSIFTSCLISGPPEQQSQMKQTRAVNMLSEGKKTAALTRRL